jgi:hypothetical protein
VVGDVSFVAHQLPILSRDEVDVEIAFNGQATSALIDGPEGWPISGKSTQTLDVGMKDGTPTEHTYVIEGSSEPLSLHISYLVTNTQVQVERMWLAPTKADVAAN